MRLQKTGTGLERRIVPPPPPTNGSALRWRALGSFVLAVEPVPQPVRKYIERADARLSLGGGCGKVGTGEQL